MTHEPKITQPEHRSLSKLQLLKLSAFCIVLLIKSERPGTNVTKNSHCSRSTSFAACVAYLYKGQQISLSSFGSCIGLHDCSLSHTEPALAGCGIGSGAAR